MIPKIIHQTAKTSNIPDVWKKYQSKVQTLHPDWEYKLWTDEDNLAFVEKEFPEYLELYTNLPKNIMRADVIRYLIMYRIGGLYLDLDYEMLRPFEFLNYPLVLPLNRSKEAGDKIEGVGNCIFASTPNHPFWLTVMQALIDDPPFGKDIDVEKSTGPEFLSNILYSSNEIQKDIFTPDREIFHPATPWSKRGYRKIIKSGIAHGIHHCSGTWRENNLKRNLFDLTKGALGSILAK